MGAQNIGRTLAVARANIEKDKKWNLIDYTILID